MNTETNYEPTLEDAIQELAWSREELRDFHRTMAGRNPKGRNAAVGKIKARIAHWEAEVARLEAEQVDKVPCPCTECAFEITNDEAAGLLLDKPTTGARWLEMSTATGQYYEAGSVPEEHSQGCFFFCGSCAEKALEDTLASEQVERFGKDLIDVAAVVLACGAMPRGAFFETAIDGRRLFGNEIRTDRDGYEVRVAVVEEVAPIAAAMRAPFYLAARELLEEGFEPVERRPRLEGVLFERERNGRVESVSLDVDGEAVEFSPRYLD